MHSSSFEANVSNKDGGDVMVSVATLITESRIPGGINTKSKKFYEGPHCNLVKGKDRSHKCNLNDSLCLKFESDRETVLDLCKKSLPLCIEVLLTCACKEIENITNNLDTIYVLEQWHFNINIKRGTEPRFFNLNQLVSAIRSQLYFSQITAWLSTQEKNSTFRITEDNFRYHLTIPGKTLTTPKFHLSATKHDFPATDIGNGLTLNVTFFSLPRTTDIPNIICSNCMSKEERMFTKDKEFKNGLVDDIMHTSCKMKGKHRCEDYEEYDNTKIDKLKNYKNGSCEASTSNNKSKTKLKMNIENPSLIPLTYTGVKNDLNTEKRSMSCNGEQKFKSAKLDLWQGAQHCHNKKDLSIIEDKGQLLLDAIERSGQKSTNDRRKNESVTSARKGESDNANCDMSESDIFSIREKNNFNIYVDKHCDSPIPILERKKIRDISNEDVSKSKWANVKKRIIFDDAEPSQSSTQKRDKPCDKNSKLKESPLVADVPSASEQAKFRKNLDNAASMVFHSRTGLPLTSSPAPVRRGKSCFDFDSSINSVSAIKSALFSNSFSTDEESESDGSIVSPCSPETYVVEKKEVSSPVKYRRKGHAANLLGSFEESVLNGRLEPVSTVHGFKAELGASGSFVPKHLIVPVTVFFYTLGDNDKVSSPYLGHINLGKKGYNVPKSGTVQVTLFNPLGTVVKMFVIMYDLSDMPPNSQTFIRQRTLYMPTNCKDTNLEWGPKWLRYLIHLRFMSSKSGKIYLHSDIRMIIFRKCDMDTATAHGIDMSYELRSFTHTPANPRFSPRK